MALIKNEKPFFTYFKMSLTVFKSLKRREIFFQSENPPMSAELSAKFEAWIAQSVKDHKLEQVWEILLNKME